MNKLKIGWFSTGRDRAARDLLRISQKHISNGDIHGRIIFNFCNLEPGENEETDKFFQLVKNFNYPSLYLSSKQFYKQSNIDNVQQRRLAYDRRVMEILRPFDPDICMLAGYMLIIGEEMCTRYKMINLHPALPNGPRGSWQEVIWELIKTKSEYSGVMMHLVTPELDSGPVITYCRYPIKDESFQEYWAKINRENTRSANVDNSKVKILFKKIREKGLSREFPLIVMTLKAICDGRIKIEAGKVFDRSGAIINGYDLTQEVNKMVDAE